MKGKLRFVSFLSLPSHPLILVLRFSSSEKLPKLRLNLLRFETISFQTKPTLVLYSTLLAKSSALKPDLDAIVLATIRRYLTNSNLRLNPDIIQLAFNIYFETEDLPSILRLLPRIEHVEKVWQRPVLVSVVTRLAAMSNPEGRLAALPILEEKLEGAVYGVFVEMREELPGWEEACEQIEKTFKRNGYPLLITEEYKKTHPDQYEDRCLEIDEATDSMGYSSEDEMDRGIGGGNHGPLDPNDSDYAEEMESRRPDLGGWLRSWMGVLEGWGDEGEREEIRKRVREDKGAFFEIDEVAQSFNRR